MATQTSTLTVRLIDAVTAPARAAARSIRGIGGAVDSVNTRRMAIAGAVDTMVADMSKTVDGLKRNIARMTAGLSMPTGLAAIFGARSVYDFEKTANAFQAVTLATDEQRRAVMKLAKELNALFPFDNKEIMGAAFELGRAGFSVDQIIGTLKDTLNLALAGDIDLQEAADIATNVLTAMRLPMKTTEQAADSLRRVNDALAYAATNSNTDVRMMGETLKYVGPMAAAAGLSIEEVAAASIVMAKNGIRASEAGVAMRSALVRMVRPTKPMLAALERLNINIDDFIKGGRVIGAQDVVRSLLADGIDASSYAAAIEAALSDPALQSSLSAMTARLTEIIAGDGSVIDKTVLAEAITDTLTAAGSEVDFFGFLQALREKGADLGDIARVFDARQGSRLITLLAGDLLGELEGVKTKAGGSADKMSKIRMQGIVGDWNEFTASIEAFFLAIADSGVLKTASNVIKSITDGLRYLAEANPALLEFATYAVMLAGVLGPLALVAGGVLSFFSTLVGLLMLVARFGKGATGILGAAMLGPGGAAGAAAAAGVGAGKAGMLGKVVRGAGVVGAGVLGLEALGAADPEGNLWGLTKPIDDWVERNFGFNPSKIGGGASAPPDKAAELEKWIARQAEIDARLTEIGKRPAVGIAGVAAAAERGRLEKERAALQAMIDAAPKSDPAAGGAAATETIDAYRVEMEKSLIETEAMVDRMVDRIKGKLSFSASPIIRPTVDGSGLRGLHADVGIDLAR